MSSLRQPNGDDYPDAAGKHVADARALLDAARHDGAGYLAGYVVECSLKSLLQTEAGAARRIHLLADLAGDVNAACLTAGAATAKYVTATVRAVQTAPIAGWSETMRYRSPSMSKNDATAWVDDAVQVYRDTVAAMILDGVIQ